MNALHRLSRSTGSVNLRFMKMAGWPDDMEQHCPPLDKYKLRKFISLHVGEPHQIRSMI